MHKKYKELLSNTTIFAIGSIGSKLINALLLPFYTYFLSTSEYGIIDLVFSISQVIVPFLSFLIDTAVLRFGLSNDYHREDVLASGIRVCYLGLILSPILSFLAGFYPPLNPWRWYLAFHAVMQMFYLFQLSYIKICDNNKLYALLSIILSFFVASCNILFIAVLKMGVQGYLLSTNLSYFLVNLIALSKAGIIPAYRKSHYDSRLTRQMVAYSFPFIFNELSWWVMHSSDKIMLERMVNTDTLGIYAVAAKIPMLITLVLSFFSPAWNISSIKEYEQNVDYTFHKKVFKVYSCILFIGAMLLNTIIKPFMAVYVSDSFFIAWQYTPVLVVSTVFSALSSFYGAIYSAMKQSTRCMLSSLCAAVLNIVLNYVLIKHYEIWGAVIASAISCFVCYLIRVVDIRAQIPFAPERKFFFGAVLFVVQTIITSAAIHYFHVFSTLICLAAFLLYREEIQILASSMLSILKARRK